MKNLLITGISCVALLASAACENGKERAPTAEPAAVQEAAQDVKGDGTSIAERARAEAVGELHPEDAVDADAGAEAAPAPTGEDASGARPAEAPRSETAPSEAGEPQGAAPTEAAPARIVFIDKEECCDCTRARTEKTWAALQAALAGSGRTVPVERIHLDTQADKAGFFREKQPLMTIPGVYLLDANGAVLGLLQGELTEAQLAKALKGA